MDENGSWKTSLTFTKQGFKNNRQCCISDSVRPMGKATNVTSTAHYAIFVKGGWWKEIRFFQDHRWCRANFPFSSISLSDLSHHKHGKVDWFNAIYWKPFESGQSKGAVKNKLVMEHSDRNSGLTIFHHTQGNILLWYNSNTFKP